MEVSESVRDILGPTVDAVDIEHHGVPGMKWGVRKQPEKSGSNFSSEDRKKFQEMLSRSKGTGRGGKKGRGSGGGKKGRGKKRIAKALSKMRESRNNRNEKKLAKAKERELKNIEKAKQIKKLAAEKQKERMLSQFRNNAKALASDLKENLVNQYKNRKSRDSSKLSVDKLSDQDLAKKLKRLRQEREYLKLTQSPSKTQIVKDKINEAAANAVSSYMQNKMTKAISYTEAKFSPKLEKSFNEWKERRRRW